METLVTETHKTQAEVGTVQELRRNHCFRIGRVIWAVGYLFHILPGSKHTSRGTMSEGYCWRDAILPRRRAGARGMTGPTHLQTGRGTRSGGRHRGSAVSQSRSRPSVPNPFDIHTSSRCSISLGPFGEYWRCKYWYWSLEWRSRDNGQRNTGSIILTVTVSVAIISVVVMLAGMLVYRTNISTMHEIWQIAQQKNALADMEIKFITAKIEAIKPDKKNRHFTSHDTYTQSIFFHLLFIMSFMFSQHSV